MKDLLLTHVDNFTSFVRLSNLYPDEFGLYRVHINHLEAIFKGGAARALEVMCHNADTLGITLSLNACPLMSGLYHTPWQADKLVAWYEKRGFKRVNTKDPLFNFMGRLMVRTPQLSCATKPVLARV
jgi:hypothetical protein